MKANLVFLSDAYNDYMVKCCPVYIRKRSYGSNKRPYLLLPGKINGHSYCIPLTSPNESDYIINADGTAMVRDDCVSRIRLGHKHFKTGKDEVLGCLVLSKMMPVPDSEVVPVRVGNSKFNRAQKLLLNLEIQAIEGKFGDILTSAAKVHKIMKTKGADCVDFKQESQFKVIDFDVAEKACLKYKKYLEKGLRREEILKKVEHLPDMLFREDKEPATEESTPSPAAEAAVKPIEQVAAGGETSATIPSPEKYVDLPNVYRNKKRENTGKVEFVYLSKDYFSFLSRHFNSSTCLQHYKERRAFIKFPYLLNGHTYCVPLTSPKQGDVYTDSLGRVRTRQSSTHILRIVENKNKDDLTEIRKGRHLKTDFDELKGNVSLCRMMPVPVSEIIPHNPSEETRRSYNDLLSIQSRCLEEIYDDFLIKVVELYNMKVGAIPKSEQFLRLEANLPALDFLKAEELCSKYKKCLEQGIPSEKIYDTVVGGMSEIPSCSTWGESGKCAEDKHKCSDSPDGGVKRKHDGDDEPRSVRRRLSDSHGKSSRSSRSYSDKGKGLGKGRSRQHAPTR